MFAFFLTEWTIYDTNSQARDSDSLEATRLTLMHVLSAVYYIIHVLPISIGLFLIYEEVFAYTGVLLIYYGDLKKIHIYEYK